MNSCQFVSTPTAGVVARCGGEHSRTLFCPRGAARGFRCRIIPKLSSIMKVIDIMEELEDSKDFDESVISEDPPVQLHNLLNGYMYVISQCICG